MSRSTSSRRGSQPTSAAVATHVLTCSSTSTSPSRSKISEILAPVRSSIALSLSKKRFFSVLESWRPTVLFPAPIGPTKNMFRGVSMHGFHWRCGAERMCSKPTPRQLATLCPHPGSRPCRFGFSRPAGLLGPDLRRLYRNTGASTKVNNPRGMKPLQFTQVRVAGHCAK